MASHDRLDISKKIKTENGFIAALDQSGGSTSKALRLFGITVDQYSGDRILRAILFENTLDREIEELASSSYFWRRKYTVPFLKVGKDLEDEHNGVQQMKPIPNLNELLDTAMSKEVFGTKMRSVFKLANYSGIHIIVAQLFAVSAPIIAKGLVPIIEPVINIHSSEKGAVEKLLFRDLRLKNSGLSQIEAMCRATRNNFVSVHLS